jgi:hypothetical protein
MFVNASAKNPSYDKLFNLPFPEKIFWPYGDPLYLI